MTVESLPRSVGQPFKITNSLATRNVVPSVNQWEDMLRLCDSNGDVVGYLRIPFRGGLEGLQIETKRTVNGSDIYNGFVLDISSTGARSVSMNDPAAWRSALGVTNILKSVNYSETASKYSGWHAKTYTAPSGYTLLVQKPLGAFASGDARAYITDRSASQSGTTVTVTTYTYNPPSASVSLNYSLLYIKSELL